MWITCGVLAIRDDDEYLGGIVPAMGFKLILRREKTTSCISLSTSVLLQRTLGYNKSLRPTQYCKLIEIIINNRLSLTKKTLEVKDM